MMEPLVKIRNLSAGYPGVPVLHDATIEIVENDFIGFIGPNGGGKTTLLKIILGLIAPTSGTVEFRKNLNIGYLAQKPVHESRFPIQVLDVVISGLSGKNGFGIRPKKSDIFHAQELMQELGIAHLAKIPFSAISGGQMQRVLLARAIVSNPQILLLDEPNTFLDNTAELWLYSKLKELNETMAIILVSHDTGAISSYVKSIACINHSLHYHQGSKITDDMLSLYNCPVELITHGHLPHRVLKTHND